MKSFGNVNDQVMQEIMKKAAEREPAEYEFLPEGEIRRRVGDVQHCINVDRRWEIVSDLPITSHRKKSGKLIVFFKQKTKKLFQWYVDSLFDQQVEFNHTMWAAYYQQKKELDDLKRELDALKKEKDQ
ncbi:MAG: hypothetical protein SO147_01155 [Clostridia bacterium]|nr:hypothetical protein [Clostridia bacterium]